MWAEDLYQQINLSSLRLGSVAEHAQIKSGRGCEGITWVYMTRRAMRRSCAWTDRQASLGGPRAAVSIEAAFGTAPAPGPVVAIAALVYLREVSYFISLCGLFDAGRLNSEPHVGSILVLSEFSKI